MIMQILSVEQDRGRTEARDNRARVMRRERIATAAFAALLSNPVEATAAAEAAQWVNLTSTQILAKSATAAADALIAELDREKGG